MRNVRNRLGITLATVTINEGVCDRTAKVRTAILGKLSGSSDCAQLTDPDLSGVAGTPI